MKEERIGYIYLLRNLINGKGYVGQHRGVSVENRWRAHIKAAGKRGCGLYVHRAIRRYGVESFSAEVIWSCDVDALNEKEAYYIKKYNTFADDKSGYNLTRGGASPKHSKQTKKKISEARLREWATPEHKARLVAKHRSEETRQLHREATLNDWQINRGKRIATARTLQSRTKVSVAVRAQWANAGHRAWRTAILRSEQTKSRMSKAAKARWADPVERVRLLALRAAKAEERKLASAQTT